MYYVCMSGSYEFNDILSEFSRLVSSAYKIYLKNMLTSGMSFMYIRKRSVPNIDPCGTPVEIFNTFDVMPLFLHTVIFQ